MSEHDKTAELAKATFAEQFTQLQQYLAAKKRLPAEKALAALLLRLFELSVDNPEHKRQFLAELSLLAVNFKQSKVQFDIIFEHAPMAFIILSKQFDVLRANRMARDLLHVAEPKGLEQSAFKKIYAYIAHGAATFIDWLSSGATESIDAELNHPQRKGQVKVFQTNFALEGKNYHLLSMVSTTHEYELHRTLTLFKLVVEHSHEAIMITNNQHQILHVNPAFTEITGYSRAEVLNQNPNILSSGRQDAEFYQDMYAELAEKGHWHGVLYNRMKDGTEFPEELHITAVYSDNARGDAVKYYIAIFVNIAERLAREQRMKSLAEMDVLTGLLNRQGFNTAYHRAFAEAQRQGNSLAVIFIDLDKFKYLNDRYGHHYGDELLKSLAARIRHNIKSMDVVARLGGDEFVILLSGQHLAKVLTHFGAKLQRLLAEPYKLFDLNYTCTASIGVALYPDDAVTEDELIKSADAAMYQAKTSGRNKFSFLNKALLAKQALEQDFLQQIAEAIERDQFQLYYQAQHDMRTGDLVGFESLVRWLLPSGEVRAPAQFLPQIEKQELMIRLGKKLLTQVFSQINVWQHLGFKWPVSINLSANQLKTLDTYNHIQMLCEQYPKVIPLLHLEVTETTIFENDAIVYENLVNCKTLGLKLVLDDFGTGYSSIYSLKKFQFEVIKVDKSFVDDILTNDTASLVILDGIIGLIQALNLTIICEGVEQQRQLDYLIQKSCFIAQGYFYNKPMPKKNVAKYIMLYVVPNSI